MLHFDSRQLLWECKEMTACESFPTYPLTRLPIANLTELENKPDDKNTERALISQMGLYYWCNIVEEYTAKVLTEGEDKLVAISEG